MRCQFFLFSMILIRSYETIQNMKFCFIETLHQQTEIKKKGSLYIIWLHSWCQSQRSFPKTHEEIPKRSDAYVDCPYCQMNLNRLLHFDNTSMCLYWNLKTYICSCIVLSKSKSCWRKSGFVYIYPIFIFIDTL